MDRKAEVNGLLDKIGEIIKPYRLAYVSPKDDCDLLEKNARFMTKEQLSRLAENAKSDGFLSQLPFAIKKDGRFKIISGNHRIKASIKAGLEFVLVQYLNAAEVSDEKQLAIQLSHNAVTGQDDLGILTELYGRLKEIDLKAYSGIDELELKKFEELTLSSINEDEITMVPMILYFTSFNQDKVDRIIEKLEARIMEDKNDRVVFANFHKFVEVMTKIKQRTNIKNNTVAFLKMIEICEEFLKTKAE